MGVPLLPIFGGVGAILLLLGVIQGKNSIFHDLTDWMMLGFIISIGISQAANGWFGGALIYINNFLHVFIGYFLVAYLVNSEKKLRIFIIILILLTSFLAFEAIVQYMKGVSDLGISPHIEYLDDSHGVRVGEIIRVRGAGTFNDPNYLAVSLVLAIPFLLNGIMLGNRIIPACIMLMIGYAIYLTNSRGGIIALVATLFSYFIMRKKNVKGMIVGLLVVGLILIFGPSRIGNLSSTDPSSMGRLDAWYVGLKLLQSNPFFGTGASSFIDYNSVVAHNSIVQVLADMGLIGGFFFVGLFYFPMQNFLCIFSNEKKDAVIDNTRLLLISIMSGLIGMMVGLFFLSRTYVFPPYMMIALLNAGIRVYSRDQQNNNCVHIVRNSSRIIFHLRNIFVIEMISIIIIYFLLRILL
jgi:O-antigen ligase